MTPNCATDKPLHFCKHEKLLNNSLAKIVLSRIEETKLMLLLEGDFNNPEIKTIIQYAVKNRLTQLNMCIIVELKTLPFYRILHHYDTGEYYLQIIWRVLSSR